MKTATGQSGVTCKACGGQGVVRTKIAKGSGITEKKCITCRGTGMASGDYQTKSG